MNAVTEQLKMLHVLTGLSGGPGGAFYFLATVEHVFARPAKAVAKAGADLAPEGQVFIISSSAFTKRKKAFVRARKGFTKREKDFTRTGEGFIISSKAFSEAGKDFRRARKAFSSAGKDDGWVTEGGAGTGRTSFLLRPG